MISSTDPTTVTDDSGTPSESEAPHRIALARYGLVPQVARFALSKELLGRCESELSRGCEVVVESDRGPEVATLLEVVQKSHVVADSQVTGDLLRVATNEDIANRDANRRQAELNFFDWQTRMEGWQLQLQLIDVEQTLDLKQTILYVLNGQDAETTRLALLAAAAGLGIIHVQPVSAEGIVPKPQGGGGCGSGGCGSGGCGS